MFPNWHQILLFSKRETHFCWLLKSKVVTFSTVFLHNLYWPQRSNPSRPTPLYNDRIFHVFWRLLEDLSIMNNLGIVYPAMHRVWSKSGQQLLGKRCLKWNGRTYGQVFLLYDAGDLSFWYWRYMLRHGVSSPSIPGALCLGPAVWDVKGATWRCVPQSSRFFRFLLPYGVCSQEGTLVKIGPAVAEKCALPV